MSFCENFNPMSWLEIVSHNGIFALALLFNSVALYLIVTRSKKEIGSYKYLLIAFLCTDSVFSLVHWLCRPVLSFRGGFFVSYGEGLVDDAFAMTLYGASGSLSFPLLACHFLYRAVVVTMSKRPALQQLFRSNLLAAAIVSLMLLDGATWIYFNYQLRLDPNDAAIRAKIVATHPNLRNRTQMIAIVPFVNGKLNGKVARNALPLLAIAASSFVIIVLCAWRITYTLYVRSSMSIGLRNMHRRMFIALIVQMLVPSLTMFAPSVGAISLPFLPVASLDLPDWMIGLCYSLYPLLDPIVITLCIRDYRVGLFQLLRIRRTNKVHITLSGSVSSGRRTRASGYEY